MYGLLFLCFVAMSVPALRPGIARETFRDSARLRRCAASLSVRLRPGYCHVIAT